MTHFRVDFKNNSISDGVSYSCCVSETLLSAAALAAQRASGKEVGRLRKNPEGFRKNLSQENLVALIRADIECHRLVANATENRTIVILMNTITRYDFHGWRVALRTKGRPFKTVAEHKRVLDAIAAGNEKNARSAMRAHLAAARLNILLSGSK